MKIDLNETNWNDILINIVLFIIALFINAWIITICWNDYLMQVVNGLHEVDMMQAIALRILVSTLTAGLSIERNEK
jgi:ABC-type sulfate transport system permease subunit